MAYVLLFTVVLGTAGVTYGILTASSIWSYAHDAAVDSVETLSVSIADAVLIENQGALRARGDAAYAVIGAMDHHSTAHDEDMSLTHEQALQFLEAQRVGEAGYIFALNSSDEMLYHPSPEVMEQDHAETSIVQRIKEQGAGYIRYFWQNPTEDIISDKYGYISYYEPWDWFIVATDYASGFLDRVPPETLQSLLDGYQQASIEAAFLRIPDQFMISSRGWASVADIATSSAAWDDPFSSGARVSRVSDTRMVAFSPLRGFDAEVGIVYNATGLRRLTTQYAYIVGISLLVALVLVYVSSRVAGRLITRPVRELADRLHRRLAVTSPGEHLDRPGDLRALVLQQLRALVKLDYESRGRRAAEHEAIIAESVFTHTTEGIIVTDESGIIIRVNPAIEAITGYPASELLGKTPSVLKSDRHNRDFYESMWEALRTDRLWVGEIWNRRRNGEEYPQLLSIRAVSDTANGEISSYVAVCHDISERKVAEDRLQYLATHDPLTGLPNRSFLNDVLEHTIRQARRYEAITAVLFLDLDDFKDVNDSYGHDTGDELLKWIARQLEHELREEDIVVRFGGDEFVIVLPTIEDAEYASVAARRILAAVRDPYVIGVQKIRPSVSIGIAIYPEAGREAGDLLRDADAAMYAAKRQGRNTFRFHNPGMNETAHRRLAMQGSVAAAIDRDELAIAFQPILDLKAMNVAGAEALVRWNREGRLVLPGEFMPYLENSSMLTRLDLWVLDQACLELNLLDVETRPDFYVSVNAGAYNLIQDDFVARVTETVRRNGVEPERIAIEVTETAAIRNFERARATLRELRSAGFLLFLDDFGEGHSSIRYLREFGVDSVKLDRGYLQNVERSESAKSLVSGFTQLAHGMRLRAVIEGVETPGQLDFIRGAGCDFAQGFLIGMPGELETAALAMEHGVLAAGAPREHGTP